MFKVIAKIILFPVIKYIINKYAQKTAQNILLFNLPNIMILLGLFAMMISIASIYVLLGLPAASMAMAAVSTMAVDPQKGVEFMAINAKNEIMNDMSKYVVMEKVHEEPNHLSYSLTDNKLVVGVFVVSVLTFYSFLVSGGYVLPITELVKNVLIGKAKLTGQNSLTQEFIDSTNVGSIANRVASATEPVTTVISNPNSHNYWKYVFTPVLALGFGYGGHKVVTTTVNALVKVSDFYQTHGDFVKGVIATATAVKYILYPLKYIVGFVFADELPTFPNNNNDDQRYSSEFVRFKILLERYGHLLGLSTEEKIEGIKKLIEIDNKK